MSALAIEINDACLAVAGETGVLASEPGYVLAAGNRLVTGTDAYTQARLKPRAVSNKHWASLDLAPGSAGIDRKRSAAELAFVQLEALWKRVGAGADGTVLVVPSGAYGSDQLGVLLGIAEQCGIEVRAVVDAAVAASTRPYPGRQLLHVDASLHRVVVTAVEQGDEAAARAEHALDGGLASLGDIFARRINELFVLATRFDPFHHAESEQALYARLHDWLDQVGRDGTAELVLPYRGEEFRALAERDALLRAAAGFYRAVVQLIARARAPGTAAVVQVSQRLAALPGFTAALERLEDAHVETLPEGHAARAVLASRAAVAAQGPVKLLKHLPWRGAPVQLAAAAAPASAAAAQPARVSADEGDATHVVFGGRAYPVGAHGIVIGRDAVEGRRSIAVGERGGVSREHADVVHRGRELWLRDLSRFGTFVNEKRVAGETLLKPADVIRVGSPGAELLVVALEAGDG